MTRLTWSNPKERSFEAGLDRGVLYPNGGTPVAWNGLTGVDEAGGEGVVAYYMDGRPFLFVPTPKEYQATLRAYTYPDAFVSAIGLEEAAEGLYLDSQRGDSFGLSYRTMVGNGVDAEAGHKIHLVYNAVVAPSDRGYTSSSEINPVQFSWEIQAVPVPVAGYRPTAHIVIDTRNMVPDRVAAVETLIYGDSTTAPSLPNPQVILDLLSYGDGVVIVDNGDGTWTATGSSDDVKVFAGGQFELNNVYAVFHDDETFTLSDEPIPDVITDTIEAFI